MAQTSYPPEFVKNLEMQWGAGYLSPGGRQEVCEIFRGIDISGKTVLDIGCGTGGPDIAIAEDLRAGLVVGIDVEPLLVTLGRANIASAGLEGIVDLKLVEVGPLPFEDESFDIVFSKDSLIHVEDKSALYKEIWRVLKPGGQFAASDWLRSHDAEDLADFREWRSMTAHRFSMQTLEETIAELSAAGLEEVRSRDRTQWYVDIASREVETMKSAEWQSAFVAAFDQQSYVKKLALRIANARAAECGGLRPTHLFGQRSN